MQETGGDLGRIRQHFYQNYIQRTIIGAIILSYLTMLDGNFNGIKIVYFINHINAMIEIYQLFRRIVSSFMKKVKIDCRLIRNIVFCFLIFYINYFFYKYLF